MSYNDFYQYNGLTPTEFLDACGELKDKIGIVWISGDDYDDDEHPEANVYFHGENQNVCIGHFNWSDEEHQWDKEYATFFADNKEWF